MLTTSSPKEITMKNIFIIAILIANISYAYSSEPAANDWILEIEGDYRLTFKNEDNITLTYACFYYSDGFIFEYNRNRFMTLDLGFSQFFSFSDNDNLRIETNYGNIYDEDIIRRIIYHDNISTYSESNDKTPRSRPNFKSLRGFLYLNREEVSSCEQKRKSKHKIHILKNIAKIAASIFGLIIAAISIKYLFRKTSNFKIKPRLKSLINSIKASISNRTDFKNEEIVKGKAMETVIDEAVRISVRHAMKDMVSADDIQICTSCKGSGCLSCDDKGWTINKSQ